MADVILAHTAMMVACVSHAVVTSSPAVGVLMGHVPMASNAIATHNANHVEVCLWRHDFLFSRKTNHCGTYLSGEWNKCCGGFAGIGGTCQHGNHRNNNGKCAPCGGAQANSCTCPLHGEDTSIFHNNHHTLAVFCR